jgi:pimeloyl-ACP methyl ester carboxylesterase
MSPTPFKVQWDEPVVKHVLARVAAYPFPQAPDDGGWTYGCDADYLKAFCAHWTEGYDWRAAEAELNRYPQFVARVEDFDLHFVHVVGEAQGKRPLLIIHGWPGSHYEFWDVIDKLAFPSKHGGKAADAFDLVIPSLPGFGFSSKPKKPVGQRTTARLFNTLMTQILGYDRYLAQGGDWGGLVTGWLGLDHPAHVKAIHLNMMGLRSATPPQGEAELAWAKNAAARMQVFGAYFQLQASKPQSLAWAMADNPVGQAAWIVERFHDWSDLRERPFETVYSMDRLLTNIMVYVMTGSFTTSVWYYRGLIEEGGAALPPGQRVETPTAFANFPGEALYETAPRSFVERSYNVARWTDLPRGGHFAAMEAPALYVDEVRAWAREAN